MSDQEIAWRPPDGEISAEARGRSFMDQIAGEELSMDTIRARVEPLRELGTPRLLVLNNLVVSMGLNRVIRDQSLIARIRPQGIHVLDPELEHHHANLQPVEAHWRCRLYISVVDAKDPETVFFDVPKQEFDSLPRTRIHQGWVKGFYGGVRLQNERFMAVGTRNSSPIDLNDPNTHAHPVDLTDLLSDHPQERSRTDDLLSGKGDLSDLLSSTVDTRDRMESARKVAEGLLAGKVDSVRTDAMFENEPIDVRGLNEQRLPDRIRSKR